MGKLIFLPFPTPYPNCLLWLQIKHSCSDKPFWAYDCNLLLLNACTASTLIDKRESEMMSFLYEWLMFCPLHFHMVWDNLGTLLPSLSPPLPLPLPLLYLLFLPFKDTSISWCEVSFSDCFTKFLYFCVQEPMTYMHWFLEEQSQDFRLSLADEYINGDEYVSQKKKQESTTSILINKSIH